MSRHRPSRTHVLLGLVIVLLATIPVVIPLLVMKSGPEPPVGVRLASGQPGFPENAPAPRADPSPTTSAPPPTAGPLAPAPTTTSATPSPTATATTTPPPAPTSQASTSAASPSATTPEPTTAEPTTPSPSAEVSVLNAAPNLVVVDVSWSPDPSGAGQPVLFSALVRNTGVTPTPPLPFGVAFSVDGTVVSWSANDTTPLGPGEQRTFTAGDGVTGAAWTAVEGEHTVEANVDDTGQIPELNENDNTMTTKIDVP